MKQLDTRLRHKKQKNAALNIVWYMHAGHSAIALNLSRHLPVATEPESTAKNAEKILQMGHHVLKSNLCKNSQNPRFSTRQLQACFTATAVDDISLGKPMIFYYDFSLHSNILHNALYKNVTFTFGWKGDQRPLLISNQTMT